MRTKTKEIPRKNYIIFFLITFFTLAFSITSYIIYENHKNYQNSIPVIRGSASEIEIKDLDEYLVENENALLYFGVATDENSRELEEKFVELINDKHLNIIYVNLTNVEDKEGFYLSFNEKYSNNLKLKDYPAFIIMHERKIMDLVQRDGRDLNIADIEQLIDIYEIKGEVND